MKLKYFLFPLLLVLLNSCEPNVSEPVAWSYADERIKIIVEGTQDSWADPWQPVLSIFVDGEMVSTQYCLPVFSSGLNKESIKVEWEDDGRGKVIFEQKDGSIKELILPKKRSLLQR